LALLTRKTGAAYIPAIDAAAKRFFETAGRDRPTSVGLKALSFEEAPRPRMRVGPGPCFVGPGVDKGNGWTHIRVHHGASAAKRFGAAASWNILALRTDLRSERRDFREVASSDAAL
jgi:hypothetical protein